MDHLLTSADISGQIGALELGDYLESHGDGALESAGADLSPQPITNSFSCIRTFRCIGDGALEAAGANTNGPPQHTNPITGNCPATIHGVIGSPCAGDGELESAAIGLNPTQPVTNPIRFCMTNPIKFCMQTFDCIGDGELESAGEATFRGGSPTQTNFIYNGRCVSQFDDGALESAAGMGLNPHPGTNTPACLQTLRLPGGVGGCVGDDVLEAAAGASMNPPITSPLNIACAHTRVSDADLEAGASMAPQVTQNIVCLPRFIDDGALEAVGPGTGPRPTSHAFGCFIVPGIDEISDATLEASMAPQVTQNIVCLPRFIDDGALEAVGPGTGPRPTSHAFGCFVVPGIDEISDAALEAAGSRLTYMPTSPPDCTISPRHSCISDAALEAAAGRCRPMRRSMSVARRERRFAVTSSARVPARANVPSVLTARLALHARAGYLRSHA